MRSIKLSISLTKTQTVRQDNNDPENSNVVPRDEWEHKKIIGMIWENHRGWRLETKLCDDLTGESTNYLINESMIRMIKESPRNRNIRFRSSI